MKQGCLRRDEKKPRPVPGKSGWLTGGASRGLLEQDLRGTSGSVTDGRDEAGITGKWVVVFMPAEGLAFHL